MIFTIIWHLTFRVQSSNHYFITSCLVYTARLHGSPSRGSTRSCSGDQPSTEALRFTECSHICKFYPTSTSISVQINLQLIYIYKEDCLSVSVCLSVSMHSHSFQDTKFKLLTQVKDFQEQVVEGLTILRYPRGLENKVLITQKT